MKRLIIQIAVTVASLALLVWLVDVPSVLAHIGKINPLYSLVALALLFLQIDLVTRRWTTMLRAFLPPPSHFRMLQAQYAALFGQLFLPASVGGAVIRVGMLFQAGVVTGVAINSVVLDRLVAAAGIILLAVVFLPIAAFPLSSVGDAQQFALIGISILVGILLLGLLALKYRPFTFWLLLLNRTPARHLVQPAMDAARELTRPERLIVALSYSLVGHLIAIGAVFTLARGMGLNIHLLDCILIMPPVMLISSLPISIAGWGVREGAMIITFGLLGVPHEVALALSLNFAVLGYLSASPGILAWLSEANRAMLSRSARRQKDQKSTSV